MKKIATKLAAFIFAFMMMVSSLAINVNAAPYDTTGLDPEKTNGTLKLTQGSAGAKADSVYTAYKVLDATVPATGQDVYEYDFTEKFKGVTGISVEDIAGKANGSDDYMIDSTTVDELAAKLENYIINLPQDLTEEAITLTAGEPTSLSIGYYLILETSTTDGYKTTKPMLVAIPSRTNGEDGSIKYNYEVEVTLKDQPLTTTKTVEDVDGLMKESAAQQVGKEYIYTIVQDIPKYDNTYKNIVFKLTDKMDNGLDFVRVENITLISDAEDDNNTFLRENDYDFYSVRNENNTLLYFDFSGDYYNNVKNYDKVRITYTAKVNANAVFGPSGNVNEVIPTFGDGVLPETDGDKDITVNYAGSLLLTKVDEEKSEDHYVALAGAEFTVYTDEECTEEADLVTYEVDGNGYITTTRNYDLSATATTDENGIVKFEGLGAGTYYIKETKAPTGYVKLKNPIKVTVTVTFPDKIETGEEEAVFEYSVEGNGVLKEFAKFDSNANAYVIPIANAKGFTLPTTGGMGTYIFTVGGAAILLVAGAMLLRNNKKTNE